MARSAAPAASFDVQPSSFMEWAGIAEAAHLHSAASPEGAARHFHNCAPTTRVNARNRWRQASCAAPLTCREKGRPCDGRRGRQGGNVR